MAVDSSLPEIYDPLEKDDKPVIDFHETHVTAVTVGALPLAIPFDLVGHYNRAYYIEDDKLRKSLGWRRRDEKLDPPPAAQPESEFSETELLPLHNEVEQYMELYKVTYKEAAHRLYLEETAKDHSLLESELSLREIEGWLTKTTDLESTPMQNLLLGTLWKEIRYEDGHWVGIPVSDAGGEVQGSSSAR